MIPRNQPQHIIPNHLILVIVHVVDPAHVDPHACEERLPARDGVRADHGVRGGELEVFVQGTAARAHDGVVACFTGGFEDRLGAGGGEGFHVGAEGGRHAVVAEKVLW